jgi:TPR repeat protein
MEKLNLFLVWLGVIFMICIVNSHQSEMLLEHGLPRYWCSAADCSCEIQRSTVNICGEKAATNLVMKFNGRPPADKQTESDQQYWAGRCLYLGEGVKRNPVEAVKWLLKASENGHDRAQCLLGFVISRGEGTERNFAEAVKWYRQSAEKGNADAQYHLALAYHDGVGVERNMEVAIKWLRLSATQGNTKAQCNLGIVLSHGEAGLTNVVEAVKWFQLAAEQGDAEAQFNLGVALSHGVGLVKNDVEAVKWWNKAAEQGNSKAQFNFGVALSRGEGVCKDNQAAFQWLLVAGTGVVDEASSVAKTIEQLLSPSERQAARDWAKRFKPGHFSGWYIGMDSTNGVISPKETNEMTQ